MGKKISEWKQKEIASYAQDHTLQETANTYNISKSTVSKYKKKYQGLDLSPYSQLYEEEEEEEEEAGEIRSLEDLKYIWF